MSSPTESSTALKNSHPIMSCEEAKAFESERLDSNEKVWAAMQSIGKALAAGISREYRFSRYEPKDLDALGLIGKGHNGGDALLAIAELVRVGRVRSAVLALVDSRAALKANTLRALEILEDCLDGESLQIVDCRALLQKSGESGLVELLADRGYDVCIDGLLGMQFEPPMRSPAQEMVSIVNSSDRIRFRVAVDMPSGFGDQLDTTVFPCRCYLCHRGFQEAYSGINGKLFGRMHTIFGYRFFRRICGMPDQGNCEFVDEWTEIEATGQCRKAHLRPLVYHCRLQEYAGSPDDER